MNFQSRETATLPEGAEPQVVRRGSLSDAYSARPFLSAMGTIAALAAIYYGFIAAPMYVSEAQFMIRGQQTASQSGLLGALVGRNAGLDDIIAVQDQITSHETMAAVEKQFNLRKSYSTFRIDPMHWMRPGASENSFLNFYRKMIRTSVNRDGGIVELEVRSFDKASAKPIADFILARTEHFVDDMTVRMRRETMKAAQEELDKSQREVQAARAAQLSYRGATSSVNPSGSGQAVLSSETSLEAQAAAIQAEMASLRTYARPDAPQMQQLQAKLDAIRAQAARLKAQQGTSGLSGQVSTYETLVIQRDTAERRLVAAQTGFDAARALAEQREKYVVRVVNPNAPDKPTLPNRIRDFLMVMVFALAGYSIVSLLLASIRDHRGI